MTNLFFHLLLCWCVLPTFADEPAVNAEPKSHLQSSTSKNNDSTLFHLSFLNLSEITDKQNEELKKLDAEEMVLTSEKGGKYRCFIPTIGLEENDSESKDEDNLSPYQLLEPLAKRKVCSFRAENYWGYELCHFKSIRQFHHDPSNDRQEFLLGTFNMNDFGKYEKYYEDNLLGKQLPMVNVEDVLLPYIEVNMTDGTLCDISQKKRVTRVLYVCIEEDFRGISFESASVFSVKETSSCEYEMVVSAPRLCQIPKFRVKTAVEHNIICHPVEGAPTMPEGYESPDYVAYKSITRPSEKPTIILDSVEKEIKAKFVPDLLKPTTSVDPALVEKFLNGDYCLKGGKDWWKYEFCYGKVVNQFHEEKNSKKVVVNLGNWNLEDHLKWLVDNPSKRPNTDKTPKFVSHFYSNGDFCEESKKHRSVEVKLKCDSSRINPDSVVLYLIEQQVCEYVLAVESPIICELLSTVNESGLFQRPNSS